MAHVVVVTTSYPTTEDDPSGHFVRAEARAHVTRGDAVTVIAPGPGETSRDGVTVRWLVVGSAFGWPGAMARLREHPWRAVSAAAFVVAARRALRQMESSVAVDAIVAHWLVPSAWPVAMGAKAPLDVVVHGSDVRVLERLPRAARLRIAGDLLRRGATFRCVSAELRERLRRATTDAVDAVSRVEPCRIDVSGVPDREAARARLGVPAEARLAVVVGRLVPSKRPHEAIRLALSRADRVVVVGDGPLAAPLARSEPRATFTGRLPRTDALTWISAADLLVSASRDEGAPTVIREARALGARVLAAPCGDLLRWASTDHGIALTDD